MGANISTVEDSRAAVAGSHAATAVSHAVFSPTYNNPTYNKEYDNMKWTASSSSSSSSAYSKSRTHPTAVLQPSCRAQRLISFHSSPSFRGYLEASKASNTLIVINFVNGWCGRCRYMKPTVHDFAAKYTNVEFVKIDVDELFDVSRDFGVQTTPTFLLIKKGRVIDRVDGARKEELQMRIEAHSVV